MELKVIFPCDPLNNSKVDPEFESEYAAVRLLGGQIALFDFDLFKKHKTTTNLVELANLFSMVFGRLVAMKEPTTWIYRGWMMTPVEYEVFYAELKSFDYLLFNKPAAYSICHVFPLSYSYVKDYAVETYSTEDTLLTFDYDKLAEFFGRDKSYRKLFVKDWVKSAKGVPGATVIDDYTDQVNVLSVMTKLVEERGTLFYYGFVFKHLLDAEKRPDGKDEEYRAFFFKDKLMTWAAANGGKPKYGPPEWIEKMSAKIPGDFYTVDFLRVGEDFVVIEVGDGGVSGLSVDQAPISFYGALDARMKGLDVFIPSE